ncbi:MAG TPA: acyltransferase family protein [Pseudonocardiaceae bacterium]
MDEPTQPIRPVQAAERSATSDKRRIVFIDIARGIGAILVFYSHITELWMRPRDENTLLVTAIDRMLRDPLHMQLQGIGQVAVPMFFMISGFVVTPLALRQGPFRFLVNRLLRIYPPLILVVVLTALALSVGLEPLSTGQLRDVTPTTVLTNSLLLNYLLIPQVVLVGVAWTLVVEVVFYLLLTALIPLLRWRVWAALLTELVLIALTLLFARDLGANFFLLAVSVSFIPIIVIGQVIWAAQHKRIPLWAAGPMGAAAWCLYVWADLRDMGRLDASYNLALAYAVLFFGLGLFAENRLRERTVWYWLSERTYSIYLLHGLVAFPVLDALGPHLPFSLAALGAVVATFGAVELCYRYVERPSHLLARKLSRPKQREKKQHEHDTQDGASTTESERTSSRRSAPRKAPRRAEPEEETARWSESEEESSPRPERETSRRPAPERDTARRPEPERVAPRRAVANGRPRPGNPAPPRGETDRRFPGARPGGGEPVTQRWDTVSGTGRYATDPGDPVEPRSHGTGPFPVRQSRPPRPTGYRHPGEAVPPAGMPNRTSRFAPPPPVTGRGRQVRPAPPPDAEDSFGSDPLGPDTGRGLPTAQGNGAPSGVRWAERHRPVEPDRSRPWPGSDEPSRHHR